MPFWGVGVQAEKIEIKNPGEICLHTKCRGAQSAGWCTKTYHFAWSFFYLHPFESGVVKCPILGILDITL